MISDVVNPALRTGVMGLIYADFIDAIKTFNRDGVWRYR
jgi:hypothetical protein